MTADGMAAVLVTLTGVGNPDEQRVTYTRTDEGVEMTTTDAPDEGQAQGQKIEEGRFSPSQPVSHPGRPLRDDEKDDGTDEAGDQGAEPGTDSENAADTGSDDEPK